MKFLLPTINEQLASGVVLKRAALILAAWCHYLELAPFAASDYNVQDEMKQLLVEKATESANGDPLAFLKIRSIFEDLAAEEKFSHQYLFFMTQIRKDGVAKVIKAIA